MKRTALAAAFGFAVAFLFGFSLATFPSTPSRSPTVTITNTAAVYVHDPYVGGAVLSDGGGTPNVTGKFAGCTQSQAIQIYDDGGSVNINCIDSYNGTSTPSNTATTPSATQVTFFQFIVDAGFPPIPSTVDGFTGLQIPIGLFSNFSFYGTTMNWDVSCVFPESWGFNSVAYTRNNALGISTLGTVGNKNWANTSLYTRSKVVTYVSAASANSAAQVKAPGSTQLSTWRGNSAGAGGFFWWARASMDDTFASSRTAMGLFNAASLGPTVDPSAALDSVYFGCDAADTNLNICSNDNSGTATCSSLGASYPCNTDGTFYDFFLAAAPNASDIRWAILRLDSVAGTGGVITSDLPRNTVGLQWYTYLNTAAQTTAIKLGFMGTCIATNY